MEQRALEQVRWLNQNGHEAWYFAPPDGEPFAKAAEMGVPLIPMVFDPPWATRCFLTLRRFVKAHNVDLIDTHVTRDAKAALGSLDLCAIVRSRHVDMPLKTSLIRRWQWRYGADHLITVAGVTRTHLIDMGLADPDRATWIGGWAEPRYFDCVITDQDRALLRADLAIAATAPVLLCAAMLRPDKGQNFLIEALALLAQQGHHPVCLFAGSATVESHAYAQGLKELAARLGVADQVRFLGYRTDLPSLMRFADVVVQASYMEGQPRALVQAFASGRPVVATAAGGVGEIVRTGETGWLVPMFDPQALADALGDALSNPAQRSQMAANVRTMAEKTMRIDYRMKETLAVYELALARAARRVRS
jgi:glycosyltransferase involved in cell wall biosynthesis